MHACIYAGLYASVITVLDVLYSCHIILCKMLHAWNITHILVVTTHERRMFIIVYNCIYIHTYIHLAAAVTFICPMGHASLPLVLHCGRLLHLGKEGTSIFSLFLSACLFTCMYIHFPWRSVLVCTSILETKFVNFVMILPKILFSFLFSVFFCFLFPAEHRMTCHDRTLQWMACHTMLTLNAPYAEWKAVNCQV